MNYGQMEKAMVKLAEPFDPSIVHWRVGSTTQKKDKGLALAYIDARHVMDRLDAVVGPASWQTSFVETQSGRVLCTLSLEGPTGWISKTDGAGATDMEGEKGAISDAFKRAAVHWGIGRYLYGLDSPWVAIKQRGKSYVIANPNDPKLAAALGGKRAPEPAAETEEEQLVGLRNRLLARSEELAHAAEYPDIHMPLKWALREACGYESLRQLTLADGAKVTPQLEKWTKDKEVQE